MVPKATYFYIEVFNIIWAKISLSTACSPKAWMGEQISIQQLSISKGAYQFFNLLKSQKSINGDIFDPPPATIRGNIINLEDPESNVIGYFYASDVNEISLFIERSELTDVGSTNQINDDCRVLRGATALKPPNWD